MKRLVLFLLALTLPAAACSSGPQREIGVGDELVAQDFSQPNSFEEGVYSNASLRIDEGRYLIQVDSGDSEIWWGQWGDTLDDVVIDVDTEQLGEREEAAWGVACRLRGQVGQQMEAEPLLELLVAGEQQQDHCPPAEANGLPGSGTKPGYEYDLHRPSLEVVMSEPS